MTYIIIIIRGKPIAGKQCIYSLRVFATKPVNYLVVANISRCFLPHLSSSPVFRIQDHIPKSPAVYNVNHRACSVPDLKIHFYGSITVNSCPNSFSLVVLRDILVARKCSWLYCTFPMTNLNNLKKTFYH